MSPEQSMPTETFFNLPEEKRARLLDVLLDEFSQNDYDNVSIGRITERAGIAKGSFYQYFADKKDCYLYLIQLAIEEKTTFLRRQPSEPSTDLFAHLRWLIEAGMQFQFRNPRLAHIAYKALFDDAPLPEETLNVIRRGGYAYFRSLVESGIANGLLDPRIDIDIAAFVLNAVFTELGQHLMQRFGVLPDQLLVSGADAFDHDDVRQAIHQVITILETGLRKK